MNLKPKQSLVWALDPFEKDAKPDPELLRELESRFDDYGFALAPVYATASTNAESNEKIEANEKAIAEYLGAFSLKGSLKAKLLTANTDSQKDAIRSILDLSDAERSPCILVCSHGRSGIENFIFGSFAEKLVMQSKNPVFFLSQGKEKGSTLNRALFATDFSEPSLKGFLRFLPLARRLHWKITIFHSKSLPIETMIPEFGAIAVPEDYFSEQEKWTKKEAGRWMKLAEEADIPTKLILKDGGLGSRPALSILQTAKEDGAGLIVMASVSGAVSASILGSSAREVFRSNEVPVLVYGPAALEASEANSESIYSI